MADLRDAFEAAGYDAVRTYIQSGNVLFESDAPSDSLEDELEAMLERRFGFPWSSWCGRTASSATSSTRRRPVSVSGPTPTTPTSLFLKAPLSSRQAMRVVELREGVDQAWPGTGVLYFARLSARRTQSRIDAIAGTPEYQQMTIRSWTTTTKLLGLLDEGRG